MSEYRILLADDDPDVRSEYKNYLTAAGYEVVEADSEQSASELFEMESFSLAIVDVMMEKADSGFSLAWRMKKANPDMPVIMVSDVNSEWGLNFSLNSAAERSWIKADAFLDKPVRLEQLDAEIQRLLGVKSCCCK